MEKKTFRKTSQQCPPTKKEFAAGGGQPKAAHARFDRAPELTEIQVLRAELAAERAKNCKLTEHIASGLSIPTFTQAGTYDMDVLEDKLRLGKDLWSGDYAPFMDVHRDANTVLGAILGVVVANQYRPSVGHQ